MYFLNVGELVLTSELLMQIQKEMPMTIPTKYIIIIIQSSSFESVHWSFCLHSPLSNKLWLTEHNI